MRARLSLAVVPVRWTCVDREGFDVHQNVRAGRAERIPGTKLRRLQRIADGRIEFRVPIHPARINPSYFRG